MKTSSLLRRVRPGLLVAALVAFLPLRSGAQTVTDPAYTISTLATGMSSLAGITIDPTTGTLYAGNANSSSSAIAYKITSSGVVTNLGQNTVTGYPYIASDMQVLGNTLYTASFSSIISKRSTTAGGGASTAFTVSGAGNEMGLTTKNGLLYATGNNGRIVSYNPATNVTTTLSTALPTGASSLSPDLRPTSFYLYFATYGSVKFRRFIIGSNTVDSTFLINGGSSYGNFAVDPTGQFIFTKQGNTINKLSIASQSIVGVFVSGLSDGGYGSLCFGPSSNGIGYSMYIADSSVIREVRGFASPSAAPPVITSSTTATGTVGVPFSYAITATNTPTSFGASSLPAGLGVNSSTGVISGTPTTAGAFSVTLSATNAGGTGSAGLALTIGKGSATVTLTPASLSHVYDASVKSAAATTSPAGLPVNFSYSGAALPPVNAGSYGVLAAVSHANYTGSTSGTLVIQPAPATITLSNLTQPYDGTPKPITATAAPAAAGVSVTYNGSPTAPSAIGEYTVAATVTNSNYTGTAGGTLQITDTVPPVLTLPANLTVEATSAAGAVATFTATASDNVSGNRPVTLTPASGSTFPLGTTTVSASATDAAGNTATGSFTVTVRDTTKPVIAPQADIVIEAASSAGAVVTFTSSATDLVSGTVAVSSSIASGTTFALGTTPVTLTATDAAGNTATLAFTITVHDTTAPVIAAQDNLIAEATSAAGAVVQFTPSATDLVNGAVSVTASPASGSTFALGNTTVTLTARDAANNAASSTFVVTVRDTTAPTISSPAVVLAEATSAAGAVVTFTASATDLVDGAVSVNASPASGSTFALGTTTVTLTATDAKGNSASTTLTVRVRDTTPPILTTPASQVLEATSAAGAVATFIANATDAVGATISTSHTSGSTFALGTTTVNVTATDTTGNSTSGTFTITVVDTTKPVLTLPANFTVEATSAAGAAATFVISATDTVSGNVAVTLSALSGSTFALGTTTVTASTTDAAGNTATGSFTVTVVDTTKPLLTLPASFTVEATSAAGAIATFSATGTDAVSAVAVVSTPASGSTFALGANTVSVTGTDAAGNVASGSFTITVVDTTKPVITQANIVTEATSAAGATATFAPTASDIVSGSVAVTSSVAPGSTFPVGTSTVTLTATDGAGNTATHVFSVTVTDTTAPVIAPQDNLVVEATSAAGAVVTFTPSALDIVTGAMSVVAAPASGTTFALGTHTVNLTATDGAGNSASSTFTVTVVDTTAPAIAAQAPITAEATSAAGAVVTFTPTATDAVSTPTVTTAPASGSTFAIGATTVTITATDAAGNTATSTFIVTVKDTIAPVLITPAGQTLEAASANGSVATFAASATDAVGVATLTYSKASGSVFAIGTTPVTVTATDAAGNSTSGTFTITVADSIAPALTLPANQTLEAAGNLGIAATFTATATDAVGVASLIYSHAPGTVFPIGLTTVTVTAKDAANNTTIGTFTISVVDTIAPALTVPANLTLEATSAAGAIATFAASATDAVGVTSLTYSQASGTPFAQGMTTVTVTAKDAADNTTVKSFTVTVRDTTAPTFSALIASSASLWPANHKMVAITLTAATSDIANTVTTKIVSVTSSEPDNGLGDGDTANDIEITGAMTLNLRAERSGSGNGRVYTITVEAKDAAGNTTLKTVTVSVPKNQNGK